MTCFRGHTKCLFCELVSFWNNIFGLLLTNPTTLHTSDITDTHIQTQEFKECLFVKWAQRVIEQDLPKNWERLKCEGR